jgi:anti-sigma regulatory factor (Ser/Thr protein kinase)
MTIQEQKVRIIALAKIKRTIRAKDLVALLKVSRQYVNVLLNYLITEEKLIKIGSTRSAFYVLPRYAAEHLELFPTRIFKKLVNSKLEEHRVLEQVESNSPLILKLKGNIRSIFGYAFTEMLNNAIEHSQSKYIDIEVVLGKGKLSFLVTDYGVGVFRNIMKKKKLSSEIDAIRELLKGKATTQPKAHSGEGIFFTSKTADVFFLDSYGNQLVINNKARDVFIVKPRIFRKGTRVSFVVDVNSNRHIKDIFDEFTGNFPESDFNFDKTEMKMKLFTGGSIYVSRSQARRILSGLEKFRSIVFDFDQIPIIGQAFADEIFRVFHEKNPEIRLNIVNANNAVKFMINRAEGNNPRKPKLFDSLNEQK